MVRAAWRAGSASLAGLWGEGSACLLQVLL